MRELVEKAQSGSGKLIERHVGVRAEHRNEAKRLAPHPRLEFGVGIPGVENQHVDRLLRLEGGKRPVGDHVVLRRPFDDQFLGRAEVPEQRNGPRPSISLMTKSRTSSAELARPSASCTMTVRIILCPAAEAAIASVAKKTQPAARFSVLFGALTLFPPSWWLLLPQCWHSEALTATEWSAVFGTI